MKKVIITFTDNTRQTFYEVKEVASNNTDYVVYFKNGSKTYLPKRNIYTACISEDK